MSLSLCTSCRRHARADEPHCPFCGGSLGEPVVRAVPRAPRVAILFAGAIGIAACSGSDDGTGVVPPYGAPFEDSAALDTGSATTDTTVTDTAKADAAAMTETASDVADTWSPVPPYGAPILDSGSD